MIESAALRGLVARSRDVVMSARRTPVVLAGLLLSLVAPAALADVPVLSLVPTSTRIVDTRWTGQALLSPLDVELRLAVRNSSTTATATNVVGRVTSSRVPTAIIDGTASFGTVAPASTVLSTDTVTLRVSSLLDAYRLATSVQVAFAYGAANQAPIARIAPVSAATVGSTVTVDGSGSSDPEGSTLAYAWTLTARPDGSAAALGAVNGATTTFVPDLPGSYTVQLIVGDGQAFSAPATATVSASRPPLLAGAPTDLATTHLGDFDAGPVDPADVDAASGVILNRLLVMLKSTATVGEVNAAAATVGASLVHTRRNSTLLTLRVPRQPTVTALHALAATLEAQPGITIATHDALGNVDVLPTENGQAVDSFTLEHLLNTRFPASWNAQRLLEGCTAQGLDLVVQDYFDSRAPSDLSSQLRSFVPVVTGNLVLTGDPGEDEHGYDVSMVLGARHDSIIPTGAHPRGDCLRIEGHSRAALGSFQALDQLAQRLSGLTTNTVVNISYGIGVPKVCGAAGSTRCTAADLAVAPPGQFRNYVEEKALTALYWARHGLTDTVNARALFTKSAGNYADEAYAAPYPGFAEARFNHPVITVQSLPNAAVEFTRADLWGGGGVAADARLTPEQAAEVQAQFEALNKLSLVLTAENVLTVGALATGLLPQPTDFSNRGAMVWAIGQGIRRADDRDVLGTSFSAPTVAGLAAYLWNLSPALRAAEVSRTGRLVQQTSRDVFGFAMIDAYSAVLALDRSGSTSVRESILDVSGNGRFDDIDVVQYLDAFANSTGTNYSRFDLNGDGQTGGGFASRMDLDAARYDGERPVLERLTQTVEGVTVTYDEEKVTDLDALCYFAYSPLYAADRIAERTELLRDECTPRLQVAGGVWTSALSANPGTSLLVRIGAPRNVPVQEDVAITIAGPPGWNGGNPAVVTYPRNARRWWFALGSAPVSGVYVATATIDLRSYRWEFTIDATQRLAPVSEPIVGGGSTTTVSGSWSSSAGADSYLARVVNRATGAIVLPVAFTSGTSATLSGLDLVLGGDYAFQVWAFNADLTSVSPTLPTQFNLSFNRALLPRPQLRIDGPACAGLAEVVSFTGTVSGIANASLTWSASGGLITSGGVWTAPGAPGTYEIRATSPALPGVTASRQVKVPCGCTTQADKRAQWVGLWNVRGAGFAGYPNCSTYGPFRAFLSGAQVEIEIEPDRVILGAGIKEIQSSTASGGPIQFECSSINANDSVSGSLLSGGVDQYLTEITGTRTVVANVVLRSADSPNLAPCAGQVRMTRP